MLRIRNQANDTEAETSLWSFVMEFKKILNTNIYLVKFTGTIPYL